MRPLRFHPPLTADERSERVEKASSDCSIAELYLGVAHPLVRVLREWEIGLEQLVWVTAVQAAGVVFGFGDLTFGLSLAIAAAVVQVAVGCRLAALRAHRRELCVELIIQGRQDLPMTCLAREAGRLVDPQTLKQLATSLEEIVKIATKPLARPPANRPLFNVRVVRRVGPELRQIASLLRGNCPCVRGVAAVERLLTSSATPLYGLQVEPLRQELWRARYLLGLSL